MPRTKAKKATRRARGTGSIFPDRRRGGWVGRVTVGRKPDGTPDRVEVRAPTQAEVVELMAAAKPAGPTTTVAEWCERWLKSVETKPQSRDAYAASVAARVLPELGGKRLSAVTAFDVEEAARAWGRRCAAGTVRRTLAVLSAAFQAAARAELVTRNPVRAVRRPRAPAPTFDLFTAGELAAIISAALLSPHTRIFALCAATGCRVGEASAIRPGDCDPATGLWRVTGTLTRSHGVGTPKSANSVRTIRVPAPARPAIAAGIPSRAYPTTRRHWHRLLDELGLKRRGIHQLRHSVISHALAAGVPLANVARDVGDAVETLVRVYMHPTPGKDVCGAMEDLLSGAKVARNAKTAGKPGGRRKVS